jgi:3-deoxy-manno-octulosonate cytidylyltransferase (CMP-KDO synthetase)
MKVVDLIETGCHDIINGYCEITSDEQYRSLSIPKVVFRPDGRLLYMSRSCIPGNKTNTFNKAWRQVCIYAFPKKHLKNIPLLLKKPLWKRRYRNLEIFRISFEVKMIHLSSDSIAVDNPEDVKHVLERLK